MSAYNWTYKVFSPFLSVYFPSRFSLADENKKHKNRAECQPQPVDFLHGCLYPTLHCGRNRWSRIFQGKSLCIPRRGLQGKGKVFSKVNLDAKIAHQGWATSGPDYRYSMCAIDFLSSDFCFAIDYRYSMCAIDSMWAISSFLSFLPSQFPTWFSIVWSKVTFIGAHFLILPNFSSLVLEWSHILSLGLISTLG